MWRTFFLFLIHICIYIYIFFFFPFPAVVEARGARSALLPGPSDATSWDQLSEAVRFYHPWGQQEIFFFGT